MKPSAYPVLIIVVIAVAGCASVKVSQDYYPGTDWSPYTTWQWRHPVQPLSGDIRIDNPLLDKRIRRAVETHLDNRNYNRVERQPSVYLTYYLSIERRIRSDTTYSSYGVGGYYYPWYGDWGTETRIYEYDLNSLIIDIHVSETDELLWRGTGEYRLRTYKSPDEAAEATQDVVDSILGQFPPIGKN